MQLTALEAIKQSSLFCGLSNDDLENLVVNAKTYSAPSGTCLIAEGDPGDFLIVLLSGEIEVVRDTGDGEASLARFGPGAFVGEMALIDEGPRTATVRAITDAEILSITREQFDALLNDSSEACRALVKTILRRLKSTEAMLVNQEKMAALGRISAGLAHELNNPASALRRSADQLHSMIDDWQRSLVQLGTSATSARAQQVIATLQDELATADPTPITQRSPLDVADKEDELSDWLGDHGFSEPWNIAANLLSMGWTRARIEELAADDLSHEELQRVIGWLNQGTLVHSTLIEIRTSASRLSEIVNAIKRYSHMDRAPVERMNVNDGIQSTLIIMRHKMRNIELILNLDQHLPEIDGYPAELNQVWTNLIDNAVDAMNGAGQIMISTSHDDDQIIVQIRDSGAGISADHQRRLFEPFFTTKGVGVGSGLGLHIAHNIVVHRHGGRIEVESQPGNTRFTVRLPITA